MLSSPYPLIDLDDLYLKLSRSSNHNGSPGLTTLGSDSLDGLHNVHALDNRSEDAAVGKERHNQ
jgi:hypothetical protein